MPRILIFRGELSSAQHEKSSKHQHPSSKKHHGRESQKGVINDEARMSNDETKPVQKHSRRADAVATGGI